MSEKAGYAQMQASFCMNQMKLGALFFDSVVPILSPTLLFGKLDPDMSEDDQMVSHFLPEGGMQAYSEFLWELHFPLNKLIWSIRPMYDTDFVDWEEDPEIPIPRRPWLGQLEMVGLTIANATRLWELNRISAGPSGTSDRLLALYLLHAYDLSLPNFGSIRARLNQFAMKLNLPALNFLADPRIVDFVEPGSAGFLATISNLEVIDAESLPWEQIINIRKDANALRKLRSLRLFFSDELADKEPAYIRDRMAQIIDEYRTECRRLGAKTRVTLVRGTINSPTMLASAISGLAAATVGHPSLAAFSMSAGAAIEVAGVLINLREARNALNRYKDTHPLAYLFDL
jgi:hypothetical protein